jgi:hypothetical protein
MFAMSADVVETPGKADIERQAGERSKMTQARLPDSLRCTTSRSSAAAVGLASHGGGSMTSSF